MITSDKTFNELSSEERECIGREIDGEAAALIATRWREVEERDRQIMEMRRIAKETRDWMIANQCGWLFYPLNLNVTPEELEKVRRDYSL